MKPKILPAFPLQFDNAGKEINDIEAEYLPWDYTNPLEVLGLATDNVIFNYNGRIIDIHEKSLYYQDARPLFSIDSTLRFLRKKFGIALNICAHDGDFYTVEPVYLHNATEGFQSKIDVNIQYSDYEVAAKEAIATILAELLEEKVKQVLPNARLVKTEELIRHFDQIRRENFPNRPK